MEGPAEAPGDPAGGRSSAAVPHGGAAGGREASPGREAGVVGAEPAQGGIDSESSDGVFVSVHVGPGAGACGLRAGGQAQCWAGQGDWQWSMPGRFVAVDTGFGFQCGIHIGGSLECWGAPFMFGTETLRAAGFPWFDTTGATFVALGAGSNEVCAVRSDGSVVCSDDFRFGAEPLPRGEFVSVSTELRDRCGMRADGTATCWGSGSGNLGSSMPQIAFESLTVGGQFACGVQPGGSAVCWGTSAHEVPPPPEGRFAMLSAGDHFVCGLLLAGDVECWGMRRCGDRMLGCVGWNEHGGIVPEGPFVSIDVSGEWTGATCGVRAVGRIVCWNDGTGTHRAPEDEFVAIDAGPDFTCGLRAAGGVSCWGWGASGWRSPPGDFVSVSAGSAHACGLRSTGEAVCWSEDGAYGGGGSVTLAGASGQSRRVGVQPVSEVSPPAGSGASQATHPPAGRFTAISAGTKISCGLRPSGEVVCWGSTLGAPAPAGPLVAVHAGDWFACGLRPDGDVLCWGVAAAGQWRLGDGEFAALVRGGHACGLLVSGALDCAPRYADLEVNAPDGGFESVSGWDGQMCGVRHGGAVACWHRRDEWWVPAPAGEFVSVATGRAHACGLRADGRVECWTPAWPPSADAAVDSGWPAAEPWKSPPETSPHLIAEASMDGG